MNRNPFGNWSTKRRLAWVVIAAFVIVSFGPGFLRSLRPTPTMVLDFFGEWASARNLLSGLPLYEHLDVTVRRYLGWQLAPNDRWYWQRNSHPPTSVLLAVPLAWLDYPDAFLVWNFISLAAFAVSFWIVVRQLGIVFSPWSLLPTVTFLLLCNPFRHQIFQGQLNLVLLLLVTATWAADRSGHPRWAGLFLAAATAIKLFPGFLFGYFLMRRRWTSVLWGSIALLAITFLTAAITGTQAFRDYVLEVLPHTQQFRSEWVNASLPAFWNKLFDPGLGGRSLVPVWRSSILAQTGALLSCAAVFLMLAWCVACSGWRGIQDYGFGLALIAMLLISPTTWDHYFLLLLVPLALFWVSLPVSGAIRWIWVTLTAVLFVSPGWLHSVFLEAVATPVTTVTFLSLHCYALMGLFFVGLLQTHRGAISDGETTSSV